MIVCTGAEHSGTGLLTRIVRTGVPNALHRALPHIQDGKEWWWRGDDFPDGRFVVIHRDRVYRNRSTVGRGQTPALAAARYDAAMRLLASLRPAFWLSLEALVLDPDTQIGLISDWLGVPLSKPEPVYDPNARWMAA